MDTVGWFNLVAAYGFATVPLIIFVVWTIKGNWYTYNLGWFIMTLDMGLWMLDVPSIAHRIIHLNVATDAWRWYYVCAEYLILGAMTLRGWVILSNLFKKEVADGSQELRN